MQLALELLLIVAAGQRAPRVLDAPAEVMKLGIALVPEGRRLFPRQTVEENLLLGAFRKKARAELANEPAAVSFNAEAIKFATIDSTVALMFALFIGWGQVVRGREKRAVQVFNESVEYWGGLQGDGKIEDFEVVLLTPHGGDLQGVQEKLDYLQWLGVDCLWLPPFYDSPLRDGGYDIRDFYKVLPEFGTVDEQGRPRWLVLAHVDGLRLEHCGELQSWESAAAWLGRFHRLTPPPGPAVGLPVHDAAWFERWARRAHTHVDRRAPHQ